MTTAALVITLAPRQVEALLWAAAAATGGRRLPPELAAVLGGVEARLLLALAKAASEETDPESNPGPRCVRCGGRRPWCRCARSIGLPAPNVPTHCRAGDPPEASTGEPAR